MVYRYVVFGSSGSSGEFLPEGEFEKLETALDFAEYYRRKYPDRLFQVRGISYSRSNMQVGQVVAALELIPEGMRRSAAEEFVTWLMPDP